MIIDLASVAQSPKPLVADVAGSQIDLEESGQVVGPAHFEGEIFRDGTRVRLRGNVKAEVEVPCSRCLAAVRRPIDTQFEDVFVDQAEEPVEKEIEVGGPELDEQLIPGEQIELIEVIREQILLDLPDQVLCAEDCKGLCPQCGANRNLIDCDCARDDVDPRWAALKDLK